MPDPVCIPERFIGCDVGKTAIVVHDLTSAQTRTLPNEPQALADFAAGLAGECLVICEATGGWEAALLSALAQAGRPAHRADARKVKAFIRSYGRLAKTDAIDAELLARYGQERHNSLVRWQPPATERIRLATLVATRADLVRDRVAWSNRAKAPTAQPVAQTIAAMRATIQAEIDRIDQAIEALLESSQHIARIVAELRTITGFGPKTAVALIALMPEIGTLNRRRAASLAGLAPHPNQSGAADRYRPTRGGRPEIKPVLFMAALAAAKHDENLSAFYKRLIATGKKPIVALTAVMRKLIVIANARVRDANLKLS
ncbi:MAG TPA: transposase [Nitrospirales bacterium]|nr:transposase [Nitrospirales bacterium]